MSIKRAETYHSQVTVAGRITHWRHMNL